MRLLALLLTLLCLSSVAQADPLRVAVIPFESGRIKVDAAVHRQLEAVVREKSAAVLTTYGYRVFSAEALEFVAKEREIDLSRCDASCAATFAQQLGLSLYLTGTVSRSGTDYIAFVRAMDVDTGTALAAVQLRAPTPEELGQQFSAKAKALFQRALHDEEEPVAPSAKELANDIANRIQGWIAECDKGTTESCNAVGYAFLYGDGVEVNEAKGALYYERSCNKDDAEGCAFLGWVYEKGLGGREKNARRAAATYERGCLSGKGSPYACTLLGELYRDGRGVKKNLVQAAQLFRDGCENGDGEACLHLGYAYQRGAGVVKSTEQAQRFFQQGCDADNETACDLLDD